jgi:hypothetical protein
MTQAKQPTLALFGKSLGFGIIGAETLWKQIGNQTTNIGSKSCAAS